MKLIQIRSVPDELHRALKVRAAREGISLSELALKELQRSIERPTREEVLDRIGRRPAKQLRSSPTAMVRLERDAQ